MKELERLKVKAVCDFAKSQKSELSVFSPKKNEETISSGKGCFYYCLAYIGSQYGMSYTAEMLSKDYVKGDLSDDDNWDGTHNKNDLNGPSAFIPNPDKDDVDYPLIWNPQLMTYIHTKFDTTESEQWTRGSDIKGYFDANGSRNSSGYLMAVVHPGNTGMTHAIILEGYKDGEYSYYDPTFKNRSTISSNRVIMGVEITGNK